MGAEGGNEEPEVPQEDKEGLATEVAEGEVVVVQEVEDSVVVGTEAEVGTQISRDLGALVDEDDNHACWSFGGKIVYLGDTHEV